MPAIITVGCFNVSWATTSSSQQRYPQYARVGTASMKPQSHHTAIQATCTVASGSITFLNAAKFPKAWGFTLPWVASTNGPRLIKHVGLKGWRWKGETEKNNGEGLLCHVGSIQLLEEPWFYQRSWQLNITLRIKVTHIFDNHHSNTVTARQLWQMANLKIHYLRTRQGYLVF